MYRKYPRRRNRAYISRKGQVTKSVPYDKCGNVVVNDSIIKKSIFNLKTIGLYPVFSPIIIGGTLFDHSILQKYNNSTNKLGVQIMVATKSTSSVYNQPSALLSPLLPSLPEGIHYASFVHSLDETPTPHQRIHDPVPDLYPDVRYSMSISFPDWFPSAPSSLYFQLGIADADVSNSFKFINSTAQSASQLAGYRLTNIKIQWFAKSPSKTSATILTYWENISSPSMVEVYHQTLDGIDYTPIFLVNILANYSTQILSPSFPHVTYEAVTWPELSMAPGPQGFLP